MATRKSIISTALKNGPRIGGPSMGRPKKIGPGGKKLLMTQGSGARGRSEEIRRNENKRRGFPPGHTYSA